jgi:pimeloyl-ACP methyl ester carboxylesterase
VIGRAAIWTLVALLATTSGASAAGQAVQLRTADGVPVAAMLYDAAEPSAPAVVLVHMLTRSKDDWRAVAERLQVAGIAALALDLRGHGASSGEAAPSAAMALDVQAAVGFLQGRAPGRPMALVGASLGASLALIAAAETPFVRGVALVSPAADYRGVRLDPAARKYGGRPMLLVASTEDPYALRTVRALTEHATAREQRLSPVAAHGTRLLERDPEMSAALVDWLRRTLLS